MDIAPLKKDLYGQADTLVSHAKAFLIIDDKRLGF